MELEEIKLKDYLMQKESGNLMVNAKQMKLERSLRPAGVATTPDGKLRFGDSIMLYNYQSECFLAANPHEAITTKPDEAMACTTGPNVNPCLRNVFIIERADPADGFEGETLHYGQDFRLASLPSLKDETVYYMHSEIFSPLAESKFSRKQEVCWYSKPNGRTLWQVVFPDPKERFEANGLEVPANAAIVVMHVHTRRPLASDRIVYQNIFGTEFEVHAHNYSSLNKTQNLVSEKKGEITADYDLRRLASANIWELVARTTGEAAAEGAGPGLAETQ
uniref:Uncharacterized protein n=1 Tax=Oxyrrhis marina TaxID=2969 RepID=A0A7S3UMR9_OXYMA